MVLHGGLEIGLQRDDYEEDEAWLRLTDGYGGGAGARLADDTGYAWRRRDDGGARGASDGRGSSRAADSDPRRRVLKQWAPDNGRGLEPSAVDDKISQSFCLSGQTPVCQVNSVRL
ncbi:hypothetical protein F2Q69_00028034 [Brassica cretica]|uniref:Uncharacterized protein n=1 Tax=Brassica cretica TaxID=69181 RepID=A0A8S9S1S8_BRACR|nr:hypothetical protein F2Q69_00028034 [Brassica cretica]